MFRSSTIIREPALNLATVIFMLKYSVKLRRYLLCGCVAAFCHTSYCLYIYIFLLLHRTFDIHIYRVI